MSLEKFVLPPRTFREGVGWLPCVEAELTASEKPCSVQPSPSAFLSVVCLCWAYCWLISLEFCALMCNTLHTAANLSWTPSTWAASIWVSGDLFFSTEWKDWLPFLVSSLPQGIGPEQRSTGPCLTSFYLTRLFFHRAQSHIVSEPLPPTFINTQVSRGSKDGLCWGLLGNFQNAWLSSKGWVENQTSIWGQYVAAHFFHELKMDEPTS